MLTGNMSNDSLHIIVIVVFHVTSNMIIGMDGNNDGVTLDVHQ